MRYPIAVEPGQKGEDFWVVVPDLNGCFSAGGSLGQAVENAKEAIRVYREAYLEQCGKSSPEPKSVEFWINSGKFNGWLFAEIEID